jgi:hypothetical protein
VATVTRAVAAGAFLFLTVALIGAQRPPVSWLDQPLTSWNKAGGQIPRPPAGDESAAAVVARCQLTARKSPGAEQSIGAAGWIPFWNFDQQLVRDDVEIVGGMRGADGMCRPMDYNLFVFVGGKFAGTLSPTPMTSRTDGSLGVARMPLPALTADFARYASTDALCCPSGHLTVRYHIDRTAAGPVVVASEVRDTRR